MHKRILALVLLSLVLCACSKDTIPETTQVEPDTMGSSETQEGVEPVSYGGIVECPIHSIDYHSFDSAFIEYVGEEAFSAWIDAQTDKLGTGECLFGYGFPDFLEAFSISEEVYKELYEDSFAYYMYDHPDAELMYHGTKEEIEAWYCKGEDNAIRLEEKQCLMEYEQALAELSSTISTDTISSDMISEEIEQIVEKINNGKQYVHIVLDEGNDVSVMRITGMSEEAEIAVANTEETEPPDVVVAIEGEP